MNFLDRMIYCPPGGQFREYYGVTAHLEPKDLSLYRQLLPERFAVPPQPIVTLYVVDFIRVRPWPLTRYQEWSVLLKCQLGKEEGWFSVTMPVTKWVAMRGGRHIGFPKYVVDEVGVKEVSGKVVAVGTHEGVEQIGLEFEEGLSRPLAEWEAALMDDPSFFKGPQSFQLVPPGKGPGVLGTTLKHVVEPRWSPRPGMVAVRVDPNEEWAGLIPEGSTFPGTASHFFGGVDLISEPAAG
jgi:hypothetical protein